jgi:hypothetical protein
LRVVEESSYIGNQSYRISLRISPHTHQPQSNNASRKARLTSPLSFRLRLSTFISFDIRACKIFNDKHLQIIPKICFIVTPVSGETDIWSLQSDCQLILSKCEELSDVPIRTKDDSTSSSSSLQAIVFI